MPQLLNVVTVEEPQLCGDYVLLAFSLWDSYDLGEVMNTFEDDMRPVTFYHHVPVELEESDHSTRVYSNPIFGQVFRMNARTNMGGKINRVIATIYDSLELMYGNPCLDLRFHVGNGSLKYKKNQKDALLDFI